MDFPTIHQGHLAGCTTMDICSFNCRGDGADIGDCHMRDHIWATIIILTIILVGNLGGLWLIGAI